MPMDQRGSGTTHFMGKTNLSLFTLIHDFCRPYHQLNYYRDYLQQCSYRNIRSCESMKIIINHIHDEKTIISSRTSYNYPAYIIKSSQIICNGPIMMLTMSSCSHR